MSSPEHEVELIITSLDQLKKAKAPRGFIDRLHRRILAINKNMRG